ncbi:MAG: hypothetical protein NVS9B15_01410 [Acidobacteriaceae bacterium]
MSRIYDALRKAEEEKQGQAVDGSVPTTAMEAAAAEVAAPPMPEVQRTPVEEVMHARVEPQFIEPPAPRKTAIAPRTAWSPVLSKLPALTASEEGADEFRRLRSKIYQYRDGQPLRSILVTSGMPGEGKSYIASNLAICLARHQDCRVLLIDGDLRKPSLHALLGAASAPGLSDYLTGAATTSQVIQNGSIPNVSFIAGGTVAANSAELAGNRYMEQLIASVSGDFDWIIVDSAPVIAVPDAVPLARACDGVLLVARSANTPYDVAQRTLKEFDQARVIGFVLNAVAGTKRAKGYELAGYAGGFDQSLETKARAAAAE